RAGWGCGVWLGWGGGVGVGAGVGVGVGGTLASRLSSPHQSLGNTPLKTTWYHVTISPLRAALCGPAGIFPRTLSAWVPSLVPAELPCLLAVPPYRSVVI